jgi:hypothetical protein
MQFKGVSGKQVAGKSSLPELANDKKSINSYK